MRILGIIKKNRILFFVLYGFFVSIALAGPHMFDVGNGLMDWRMSRVLPRYESLITNGTVFTGERDALSAYGLYLPYLMKWTGITDTTIIGCVWQTVFGIVVLGMYPLMSFFLFENTVAALMSPFVVHFFFSDMLYVDKYGEYYSGMWSVSIGLPLVLLLIKKNEKKWMCVLVGLLTLVIMVTNTIRYFTGFSLLVAVVGVLIWKLLKHRLKIREFILLLVILGVGFNLLNVTIPKYLSEKKGIMEMNYYTACPFHTALIGLGYIDNEYGLEYCDDIAFDMVSKKFPGDENKYPSPNYGPCVKRVFFELATSDPFFVAKALTIKAIDCMRLQIAYCGDRWYKCVMAGVVVLTVLLYSKNEAYSMCRIAIVGFLCSCSSCVWGIIAIPKETYILGGLGGIGVTLSIVCIGCISAICRMLTDRFSKIE